jgi:hypothetical protein
VTVNVRDNESNPIANVAVVVSSSRGASDVISTANANTNAAGQAVFYVNSTLLGRAVLNTTADGVALDLKPIVYFLNDNPMADFTAASAEAGMTPGTNSPFFTSSWRNRAGSTIADASLGGFAMTASSGWSGNGGTASVSDPYQLRFDGTTSSQINLGRAAIEAGLIEAFVRMPASINTAATRGRVILSNSSAINSGFTLRHSNRGAAQIAASQALKLELVNGNQSYADLILGDGATRYWVDPTSSSLDEARSGTSLQSVGANNVNEGGFGNSWGCRDYGCTVFGTVWANSYPSQGNSMKRFVSGGYSYSTTDIPATTTGNLSLEAWAYFEDGLGTHSGVAHKAVIASKRNGSGLVWVLYALQGKLYWEIGGQTLVSTSSVTHNTWYHVAVTQSGSTATLYINGSQDTQTNFSSFTLSDSAAPVSIGRDSVLSTGACPGWCYGGQYNFRGYINHVALYQKALSLSEVSSHYSARTAQACEIAEAPRANEWQYLTVWSANNTGLIAGIITSASGVAGRYTPSRCRVTVSPVAGATRAFKTSSSDLIFGSSLSGTKPWEGSVGEVRSFPISSVLIEDVTSTYAENCLYTNYVHPTKPAWSWSGWRQNNDGTLYGSELSCESAYQGSFPVGIGYPKHYNAEKGSYP